jgi:hypothetical protein
MYKKKGRRPDEFCHALAMARKPKCRLVTSLSLAYLSILDASSMLPKMAPCGYGNSRTAGCGLWDADDRDHQAFGWEVPGSRIPDSARFFHAEVIER